MSADSARGRCDAAWIGSAIESVDGEGDGEGEFLFRMIGNALSDPPLGGERRLDFLGVEEVDKGGVIGLLL